jgi:serine/threonine protein kinase
VQDNVLVENSCETLNARICDFGLSTVLEAVNQDVPKFQSGPRGSMGSVRWLAPEYVQGLSSKHMPGDVYAWACICLEASALLPAMNMELRYIKL